MYYLEGESWTGRKGRILFYVYNWLGNMMQKSDVENPETIKVNWLKLFQVKNSQEFMIFQKKFWR